MRQLSRAATEARVSGLEASRALAYAYVEQQTQLGYDLHAHSRHQLQYAFEGCVRLEAEHARYVLPPQRAVFIPAGVAHATLVRDVRMASVFFSRRLVPHAPTDVRVLSVTPLMHELITQATRWPAERDPRDRTANAFFASFGLLLGEWLQSPVSGRLPRGETREVRAAIDHILEHLADATLESAARAARTSTRTLRRRIQEELGTSFRDLHAEARLLRAMELLGDRESSITGVAFALGYDSLSAFSRRFARFCGELPSEYRQRIRGRDR